MPTNVEASHRFLRYGRNDKVETTAIIPPPAIAVLRKLAKEEVKQNVLILRPLLLTAEGVHSY